MIGRNGLYPLFKLNVIKFSYFISFKAFSHSVRASIFYYILKLRLESSVVTTFMIDENYSSYSFL